MTTFYLGTHQPHWLALTTVPLMVSRRRLAGRVTQPRAVAPWVLDSGGFSELQLHGRWTVDAPAYVDEVRRYRDEIGRLAWAAPQDWMCEPSVIAGGRMGPLRFAGTGLSVREHQQRTVDNYLQLRDLAPDLPWIPVIQGYTQDEYLACVELYASSGADLTAVPVVGLGSVCRRQATAEAHRIIAALHNVGVTRLHGFGVKTLGLARYGHLLASADSLAWSYDARRKPPLPGCTGHKNCANCLRYALSWRERVAAQLDADVAQPDLFGGAA